MMKVRRTTLQPVKLIISTGNPSFIMDTFHHGDVGNNVHMFGIREELGWVDGRPILARTGRGGSLSGHHILSHELVSTSRMRSENGHLLFCCNRSGCLWGIVITRNNDHGRITASGELAMDFHSRRDHYGTRWWVPALALVKSD
jgi:hypothetical protein